ncbi:uncharacterized protein BDZ99DRAFT_179273 [Mytilinidion resinicola]|uniref:Uncharacterized protein n=1 Tax=Mytilinidion resinicola TaxID=574789 RepID=A0A6A6Y4S4_9PEZI|nr:uncharacterized protein BDZ99DRAFT_179273 [Mytilinidion resinicola]KAF2803024.1 hypothetical protein BDZ99DRAFT_179273 [Mytilinidion resinicola]
MLISCSLPTLSSLCSDVPADSFQLNVSQASPPGSPILIDCTRTTSSDIDGSSVGRRLARQRQEQQIAGRTAGRSLERGNLHDHSPRLRPPKRVSVPCEPLRTGGKRSGGRSLHALTAPPTSILANITQSNA